VIAPLKRIAAEAIEDEAGQSFYFSTFPHTCFSHLSLSLLRNLPKDIPLFHA
jgi:hypothetical protein